VQEAFPGIPDMSKVRVPRCAHSAAVYLSYISLLVALSSLAVSNFMDSWSTAPVNSVRFPSNTLLRLTMSDSLVRWERQSGVVTEPEDAASPDIGRKIERHRKKAIYRLDTYLSRQQYCLTEDEGFEVICHNRRASSADKQQLEPRDLTTSRGTTALSVMV
jgi:hypothetical protein